MLRLLRRSNSNRSNCSADAVVVIPNAATNHDRAGTCTSTLTTTAVNNNNNNGTGTGGGGYRANRYSMVESCAPPASTRAKDLEQHRRYRPHSQARRLRKTRQVRDNTRYVFKCFPPLYCYNIVSNSEPFGGRLPRGTALKRFQVSSTRVFLVRTFSAINFYDTYLLINVCNRTFFQCVVRRRGTLIYNLKGKKGYQGERGTLAPLTARFPR